MNYHGWSLRKNNPTGTRRRVRRQPCWQTLEKRRVLSHSVLDVASQPDSIASEVYVDWTDDDEQDLQLYTDIYDQDPQPYTPEDEQDLQLYGDNYDQDPQPYTPEDEQDPLWYTPEDDQEPPWYPPAYDQEPLSFLPEASPQASTGVDGPDGATRPLSETFLLNSSPTASKTIYLDFDGNVTSGMLWNLAFNGNADIVSPAFDFDGNPSSFSDPELQRIQWIWQRVVEDFAPFDVNVTTQDPGVPALSNGGGADQEWGNRIVIGGSSFDWYGPNVGGVANTGSFDSSVDNPAFVFPAQLGNGNEKITAEAISHEAGHTLGLSHDGRTSPSETYYTGHGSGTTGWAPIMGTSYYQNLTQWSRGEYTAANNTQDDLQVITSNNGFGYRIDDIGDSAGTAAVLDLSTGIVSTSGIIERNSDVDVFAFSTGGGELNLNVSPYLRGPNLDIMVELYDASENLLVQSNPADLLSASISLSLAAGDYTVRVSGVGKGDPLVSGYTDYGSLGQYWIDGSVVAAAEVEKVVYFNQSSSIEANATLDGSGQRSIIRRIEVTFSGPVTVPLGPVSDDSFILESTDLATAGMRVGLQVLSSQLIGGKQIVVLGFTGTTLIETLSASQPSLQSMLVDGMYRLTVDGSKLGIDANGAASGTSATDDFFRLYGDSDSDGDVDLFDFARFRNIFGTGTDDYLFDFDHSGITDLFDFARFRDGFGTKLF